MAKRVLLLKLAAIGDVALACQVLRNMPLPAFVDKCPLEIHWVIDKGLIKLARALLDFPGRTTSLHTVWHGIDSAKLFSGSPRRALGQALALLKIAIRCRPTAGLLLHRDWRYRLLLRPLIWGPVESVGRNSLHESDEIGHAVERLIARLTNQQVTPLRLSASPPVLTPEKSGEIKNERKPQTIGLHIGGARNQKVSFPEKLWPYWGELLKLLLEQTAHKVTLFGGPEDRAVAAEVLAAAGERSSSVRNLVGALRLEDLPQALSELDTFVSIDTGLAHIASCVMTGPGQRLVTLFGPTDPAIWAPRAMGESTRALFYKHLPCSPCYKDDGKFHGCQFTGDRHQQCMRAILPAEVLRTIEL